MSEPTSVDPNEPDHGYADLSATPREHDAMEHGRDPIGGTAPETSDEPGDEYEPL